VFESILPKYLWHSPEPRICQNDSRMWNKSQIHKIYKISTIQNTIKILYTILIVFKD